MRARLPRRLMVSVALCLAGGVVHAAPSLRVRAPTRIDAHATRSHGALVLQGQLKDDQSFPIATAAVAIQLKREDGSDAGVLAASPCGEKAVVLDAGVVKTTADGAGRFCVRLPVPVASYKATVVAAGSDYLTDGSEEVAADLTRPAVVLKFDPEPRNVSVDAPAADLDALATLEDDDASSPAPGLDLWLETEAGLRVGQATTDAGGRARFRLDPTKVGPPGRGELRVRFAGSVSAAPSVHSAPVERDARVVLAPKELVRGGAPEDGILLPITATTKLGAVGSGNVEAKVSDVVVGAAPISSGEAPLVVTFGAPKEQVVALRVRYVADAPWLKPGDELLINLPVETPSPMRQLPLVVIGGALAAWLIAGRLARRRAHQPKTKTAQRTSPEGVPGISIIGEAPRSRRGPLVGRVVDAHDGNPVARARVAIEEPRMQDTRIVTSTFTDENGHFRLDDGQSSAAMHLVAEGPLHSPLRQPMPNAAEIEVALVLRKRRILERLVRWARTKGGPFDSKPEPTPGQVRNAAGERPDVERWADAVERAAYDQGDVDARVEQEIEQLAPEPPDVGRMR